MVVFVGYVVIGIVAGWLAGQFMRGNGLGLLGDMVVGIVGALAGGYVFATVGVELGGVLLGKLAGACIGAVALLFVVRFFTGRRGGRRVWS